MSELKKELESQARIGDEFLQWKLAKNKILTDLQSKNKQLDRWSHVNIDKLVLDSQKKDKELETLRQSDLTNQKKIDAVEERYKKVSFLIRIIILMRDIGT